MAVFSKTEVNVPEITPEKKREENMKAQWPAEMPILERAHLKAKTIDVWLQESFPSNLPGVKAMYEFGEVLRKEFSASRHKDEATRVAASWKRALGAFNYE